MENSAGFKGFTDTPIADLNEESLGLGEYASALSEFVKQCDTPMTVALQGDWGSGKTSMMNLIKNCVCSDTIKGVWFNTWQYSQFSMGDSLALSLLSHFIREVSKVSQASTASKAKNLLGSIARFTAAATVGAVASKTGVDLKAGMSAVGPGVEKDHSVTITTLKTQLQDLVNSSEGVDRYVVFIDDLDRLVPVKAVELLESMKLFLDIDKCVFVLAVDYQVVVRGLKEKFGAGEADLKGKSFFDKIIQVPFNMPLTHYEVTEYFRRLLTRLGIEASNKDIEQYVELVNHSIGFNPRSLKRVFNSLLLLQIVADKKGIFEKTVAAERSEVSKILFGILCMQHSYSQMYRFLSSEQMAVNDDLFKKMFDTDALLSDQRFADLRAMIGDKHDDDYYPRLSDFMDAFYNALQLKSDAGDAAGKKLSKKEAKNLEIILSFSDVVAADGASQRKTKKLSKDGFVDSLSDTERVYFDQVLGFLDDKGTRITMGTKGFSVQNAMGKSVILCYPTDASRPCQLVKRYLAEDKFNEAMGFLKERNIAKHTFRIGELPPEDLCALLEKIVH